MGNQAEDDEHFQKGENPSGNDGGNFERGDICMTTGELGVFKPVERGVGTESFRIGAGGGS